MNRAFAFLGLSLLVGCGSTVYVDPMEAAKDPNQQALEYPAGPYGYSTGSVIANLQLTGQIDSNGNGVIDSGDAIVPINFANYYKRRDKVKVLVVMVAAEWCIPCRQEQPGLVQMYKAYQTDGKVEFLEAIVQDKGGKPADIATVDRWSSAYQIPFSMAADPTVALGPYYNVAAFPMQMVIQTKDMTATWQNNGLANMELKNQIDAVLAAN